jgi:hypothetical protein
MWNPLALADRLRIRARLLRHGIRRTSDAAAMDCAADELQRLAHLEAECMRLRAELRAVNDGWQP